MSVDFPTAQAVTAAVAAIIAWAVTSWIRLRRDLREGRQADLDLFNAMRATAAEQMAELRTEMAELRERIAVAESQAERAEREAASAHQKLVTALHHLSFLEDVLRGAGIPVPVRPSLIAKGSATDA